jgi:colicin import membrane protein
MSGAALAQDSLLPQPTGGLAPGAAAALVVHAGLIAALTLGIDWRSHPPEAISAELWAAVPQVASPAPPPLPLQPAPAPVAVSPAPPPPPAVVKPQAQPEADIATERSRLKAEKLKADEEAQKAEAERKRRADEKKAVEKKADDKKASDKKAEDDRKKREAAEATRLAEQKAEEKAEDDRLAKQRQENLRRMMGQAGTSTNATGTSSNSGTGSQNAAPSANYLGRLRKQVRDAIVFNGTVPGNAAAEVSVTTAPGGTIISSRLLKSSGHKDWDDAVLRALEKLGALARDTDGRVPPSLTLVFKQND